MNEAIENLDEAVWKSCRQPPLKSFNKACGGRVTHRIRLTEARLEEPLIHLPMLQSYVAPGPIGSDRFQCVGLSTEFRYESCKCAR